MSNFLSLLAPVKDTVFNVCMRLEDGQVYTCIVGKKKGNEIDLGRSVFHIFPTPTQV